MKSQRPHRANDPCSTHRYKPRQPRPLDGGTSQWWSHQKTRSWTIRGYELYENNSKTNTTWSKDLQINVKDLHKNQCSKGMLLAQPLQGLRHLVGKGWQVVLDLKWLKEWTNPFQNSSERISRWTFLSHVSPKSCAISTSQLFFRLLSNDQKRRMCSFVFIYVFHAEQMAAVCNSIHQQVSAQTNIYIYIYLQYLNLSKKIRPKPTTSMNIYIYIYIYRNIHHDQQKFQQFHKLFFPFVFIPSASKRDFGTAVGSNPPKSSLALTHSSGTEEGLEPFLLSQKSLQGTESFFVSDVFNGKKKSTLGACLYWTLRWLDSSFKWNQRPLDRWSCGWRLQRQWEPQNLSRELLGSTASH